MMSIVQSWLFPHSLLSGWTEIITCPRLSPLPPALPFHHLVIMTLTPLTPRLYLDTQIGVDGIDEDWEGRQGFILSTVSFTLLRLSVSGPGK